MKGIFRFTAVAALSMALAGCKLAIMVSSEGNVDSLSGTRDCNGPGYCEFSITDPDFSESFTAVPRPGHTFVRWQDGKGFMCANSIDPVCVVQMPEGFGASIVALFSTGSIRPVFSDPGGIDTDDDGTPNELDEDDDNDGRLDEFDDCPLDGPDLDGLGCPVLTEGSMVRIGDKDWAQPMLFDSVSWYDVSTVCDTVTGACSGKLNDIDVTGWTWATGAEVTELLNGFMGTSLGAVPDFFYESERLELSPNIFNYFFAYETCCTWHSLNGWLREEANFVEGYHYGVSCSDLGDDSCSSVRAGSDIYDPYEGPVLFYKGYSTETVGVWLHRPN